MKIVIDGRWLGRTGIGRYSSELLAELQKQATDHEYVVLLLPEQFEKWVPSNARFTKALTTSEVYSLAEQFKLPFEIYRHKPDLVHFQAFNLPLFYFGRYVVTIHDLTLVKFKNVRGSGAARLVYAAKQQLMKLVLWSAIKRAAQIMTPAEYTKDALVDRYSIGRGKITTTLLAVGDELSNKGSSSSLRPKTPFLLYVGNYYPYKNVGALVAAFNESSFKTQGGSLVLVGKPEYFQNLIRAQVETLKLSAQVLFPGFVTDEELTALYKDAHLFVFPSLSEGFGLPGLEAMAYGTPVLSAYASCLPEIYGDAAHYFDPNKTEDLTAQLDLLLRDGERRQALVTAGYAQIKLYSWAKTAEQTLAVYREAK
jgi:glycosyltransferase involved in cell wall biosynthesis